MKKISFILFLFSFTLVFSQKEIVLRLHHSLNDSSFGYNKNFTLNGKLNFFTRLQYYLSGFEIQHDQGQISFLSNSYVLASGHITNYHLGSFSISSVESIKFDVGVDQIANSSNTTNYSSLDPLGPKSPPMDWGWPSGYFFVVTNGFTDSNNNNLPDTPFQLHALGDHMLTSIDPIYLTPVNSNDTIYLDLIVNAERFLSGLNLSTVGIDHSSSLNNLTMCNNTSIMNIFEPGTLISTDYTSELKTDNYIYLDYTLPFAPTINYHFQSRKKINLTITDINGRTFLKEINFPNEGSYFPLKEFSSGLYIVSIDNGFERLIKKFNVVQ